MTILIDMPSAHLVNQLKGPCLDHGLKICTFEKIDIRYLL